MKTQDYILDITTGLVTTQDQPRNEVFLISDPGLEEIVANEIRTYFQNCGCNDLKIETKPFGFNGQLKVETPKKFPLYKKAVTLRSIHQALIPIHHFVQKEDDTLDHIESEIAKLHIPILKKAHSFRVTTHRSGKHNFNSNDVERRAGGALWRKYRTPVDLKNYEIDIRVDIFEQICFVGIPLHKRSLSNRFPRKFQPRTALKASTAYAALSLGLVDTTKRSCVLDPFCGSGTILFEAAHFSSRLSLYGSDIDPYIIEGAQENSNSLKLTKNIRFLQGDARELNKIFPNQRFDHIITNPPYGIRFGQHLDFERFYIRILQQFWYRLKPNATVVIIVLKWTKLNTALRLTGLYKVMDRQRVDMGDVKPHIVALRRIQKAE